MQYLYLWCLVDNFDWFGVFKWCLVCEVLEQGVLINSLCVEFELGLLLCGGLLGMLVWCVGDGWQLFGYKFYIIGIFGLIWLVVWVCSDELIFCVGIWLVCCDSLGICIVESWDYLGMCVSGSYEVFFEEVVVFLENVIGLYFYDQFLVLDQVVLCDFVQVSVVLFGVFYDGIVGSVCEWFVGWLCECVLVSFGVLLVSLLRMQEVFGEIDGLFLQNCLLFDVVCCGQLFVSDFGLFKVVVIDNVLVVVEKVLELSGNYGFSWYNLLQWYYCDVFCGCVYMLQKDSVWSVVGRVVLSF